MDNSKLKKKLKENLLKTFFLSLIGARRQCYVVGPSMMPTLDEGDLIIYKPFKNNQDTLSEGSLVVVNHPLETGTLIIKRISKVNYSSIEVLGDNRITSIDSRHFGAINKNLIEGIVKVLIHK